MNDTIININGETFQVIPLPYRNERNFSQWIIFEGRLIHCLMQRGDIITSITLDEYNRRDCQKVIASTMMLHGVPRILQRAREF